MTRLAAILSGFWVLTALSLAADQEPAGETAPPAEAAPFDGAFDTAIAAAQRRTVKLYGGSIGRIAGYGTGILVSPDGDILTTQGAHLAASSLRVALPDGTTHPATVVRRSQQLQAALLKIDAKTPEFFDLSQPSVATSGDWVLAVSNAFKVAEGTEPLSVNLGVVSLRTRLEGRRGVQDLPYRGDLVLLDAIVSNPGAAGGSVVDVDGKLLGMIGRLLEDKNTNTRVNYAVPSDRLAEFLAGKEPTPAVAGTNTPGTNSGKPIDLGVRLFKLGGRKAAAYVDRVLPNSPAARAGVKPDDLIVALGGETIRTADDFQRLSAGIRPGGEVAIEVKRKDQVLSLMLTIPAPAPNP